MERAKAAARAEVESIGATDPKRRRELIEDLRRAMDDYLTKIRGLRDR
jgi:predicted site-specific integrase-resolvase